MLESLIGNIHQTNTQLPLQYGGMYGNAFAPMYGYYGQQANNMSSLGGQSMGLYGNLASQDMDAQRFNSLAPVLSSLLGQYGGGGGGFGISSINSPMAGYQGVVDNAYRQARSYDGNMEKKFKDHMGMLPKAPYMAPPAAPAPQPQQRPAMDASAMGASAAMQPMRNVPRRNSNHYFSGPGQQRSPQNYGGMTQSQHRATKGWF